MQNNFEKSVRIPVRVRKGKLEFLYGTEMPKLREGAIGEVLFEDSVLEDDRWRAPLNQETVVDVIGEEDFQKTFAAIAVQLDYVPVELQSHLLTVQNIFDELHKDEKDLAANERTALFVIQNRGWIKVELTSPLRLRLRGERPAKLQSGECFIPALKAMKVRDRAISLNQALTLISTQFEPSRQSYGGNAFRDVLLQWENSIYVLQQVRQILEARHETERLQSAGLDPEKFRKEIREGLFNNEFA